MFFRVILRCILFGNNIFEKSLVQRIILASESLTESEGASPEDKGGISQSWGHVEYFMGKCFREGESFHFSYVAC